MRTRLWQSDSLYYVQDTVRKRAKRQCRRRRQAVTVRGRAAPVGSAHTRTARFANVPVCRAVADTCEASASGTRPTKYRSSRYQKQIRFIMFRSRIKDGTVNLLMPRRRYSARRHSILHLSVRECPLTLFARVNEVSTRPESIAAVL
jgi:hypothetical protein